MSHSNKIKLEGVIPATLLAFDKDFQIDEKSSRKHIKTCSWFVVPRTQKRLGEFCFSFFTKRR